jgi:exonuclease SbcD
MRGVALEYFSSPRNGFYVRMEATMPERPFRFLHAADLRLDQPVSGVPEAADELVDLLIDCPLKAAERVFDAAISQRVDFVVLAGNVIDVQWAAPREWLFLAEQFERLARHGITVYWAGGSADSVRPEIVSEKGTVPFSSPGIGKSGQSPTISWPDFVKWPANVRYFPPGRVERYRFEVAGITVAEIAGASHSECGPPKAYELTASMPGVFSIAVASANWSCSGLQEHGINYWALGGSPSRATPLEPTLAASATGAGCVAHFPGTPQGRAASETGAHGCTLVSVDEHSRTQLTPLDCDVVRWHRPRVSVGDAISSTALADVLCRRGEQLLTEQPNLAHLVRWQIEGGAALRRAIRRGELKSTLLDSLRVQLGDRSPPCWTVSIEAELPQDVPRAWHDEDSIRGDFLRELRQLRTEGWAALDNLPARAEGQVALATDAGSVGHDAAWLGADLLSPQEAVS